MGLYPHQLSGGMLQRCLIALVLFLKPSLIVADEPTTNLDNIVERQIIDLFAQLQDEVDAGFIFITHDMRLVAEYADRCAVLCDGKVIFDATPAELFSAQDVMQRARLKPPSVYEFSSRLLEEPVLTTRALVEIIGEAVRG